MHSVLLMLPFAVLQHKYKVRAYGELLCFDRGSIRPYRVGRHERKVHLDEPRMAFIFRAGSICYDRPLICLACQAEQTRHSATRCAAGPGAQRRGCPADGFREG